MPCIVLQTWRTVLYIATSAERAMNMSSWAFGLSSRCRRWVGDTDHREPLLVGRDCNGVCDRDGDGESVGEVANKRWLPAFSGSDTKGVSAICATPSRLGSIAGSMTCSAPPAKINHT